jgi:hypothetical protein
MGYTYRIVNATGRVVAHEADLHDIACRLFCSPRPSPAIVFAGHSLGRCFGPRITQHPDS